MAQNKSLTVVTIAISSVALVLSLFSTFSILKVAKSINDDTAFNTKVEAGILAYVDKEKAKQQGNAPAAPTEPVEVSIDDDAVKGDKDAPITIVEFSDFECPYCKRYVDGAYKEIVSKYIETGKVKYVFRDFPLSFHQNAMPAAIASECIREEGGDTAYWKMHDKMFEKNTTLTSDNLKSWAKEIGYDITKCLDEKKYTDEVNADMKAGQSYGVKGTPAFFINGKLLSGAQPFTAFETAIEAELAK